MSESPPLLGGQFYGDFHFENWEEFVILKFILFYSVILFCFAELGGGPGWSHGEKDGGWHPRQRGGSTTPQGLHHSQHFASILVWILRCRNVQSLAQSPLGLS